jgi:hypothetical protein
MNLPFLFWRSLTKMASHVQKHPESVNTNLFHHELVKLLLDDILKK